MADIFLSYAREDDARAAVVARVLGELGWSVFWDRRIIAGTSWDEVVERELGASKCVVVLWSAASVTSRWVKTEATFGLQRGTLVPATLDRSEPPLAFRFLESAQLHDWTDGAGHPEFSVLSEGIAQHVKPAPTNSEARSVGTYTFANGPLPPTQSFPASPQRVPDVPPSSQRSPSPSTALAPELASPGSWRSALRKKWVPIASAAVGLAVIVGIVLTRDEEPRLTDPAAQVPFGAPVRFRTDLWHLPDEPLLGFVEIPEGQFTMGSDKQQDVSAPDDEMPQHTVVLNRYYIGRYEVTVGQFRAFAQSSGYVVDRDALNGAADLPVSRVSWHDAVAYSTWLDERLRQSGDTPAGVRVMLSRSGQPCRVTLPSEAEWEKAARGTDGRVYPWGEKHESSKANDVGSGKGGPTPVGSYPAGASPYGVLDMSGNVWEWTRSLFGMSAGKPTFGYPYRPDDPEREDPNAPDSVVRVARGGAFGNSYSALRAATRGKFSPSVRDADTGFRVAVSCLRS